MAAVVQSLRGRTIRGLCRRCRVAPGLCKHKSEGSPSGLPGDDVRLGQAVAARIVDIGGGAGLVGHRRHPALALVAGEHGIVGVADVSGGGGGEALGEHPSRVVVSIRRHEPARVGHLRDEPARIVHVIGDAAVRAGAPLDVAKAVADVGGREAARVAQETSLGSCGAVSVSQIANVTARASNATPQGRHCQPYSPLKHLIPSYRIAQICPILLAFNSNLLDS